MNYVWNSGVEEPSAQGSLLAMLGNRMLCQGKTEISNKQSKCHNPYTIFPSLIGLF